jgi:hypothetical protein
VAWTVATAVAVVTTTTGESSGGGNNNGSERRGPRTASIGEARMRGRSRIPAPRPRRPRSRTCSRHASDAATGSTATRRTAPPPNYWSPAGRTWGEGASAMASVRARQLVHSSRATAGLLFVGSKQSERTPGRTADRARSGRVDRARRRRSPICMPHNTLGVGGHIEI